MMICCVLGSKAGVRFRVPILGASITSPTTMVMFFFHIKAAFPARGWSVEFHLKLSFKLGNGDAIHGDI